MKRIVTLLLALCLMLCACSGGPAETSAPPDTTEAETQGTVAADTTGTTDAPTDGPTDAPVLYRHPLNGAPLDEPWTGRATAVVINNITAALPHHGTSSADILYELETEGGITRMLAIFSDLSEVGSIGPVRSARTFFNNIALSHDAPLVHCGGSSFALNAQYSDSGDTISDWNHINEMSNGSYFFRDYDRYNSGYAWEHTLFTNGELLTKALAAKGYDSAYEVGYDHGLQFDDEVTLNGKTANTVTVTFGYGKTTTMTYNAQTGLYEAAQYGSTMVDANTGNALAFRNVLVLYTDQWGIYDGVYTRSFYELSGSGEGHFACNGQIIPIKWSRDTLRGSFSYTLADGTPLTLGVGTTYVGIVSDEETASYN